MFVCLFACFFFCFSSSSSLCCALFQKDFYSLFVHLLSRILGRDGKYVVVAYARLQNARKHSRMNGANILWIKFHLMCFLFFYFSFFFHFIWIAIGLSNVNNPLMLTFFLNGELKRKIHFQQKKKIKVHFIHYRKHTNANTHSHVITAKKKKKWVDRWDRSIIYSYLIFFSYIKWFSMRSFILFFIR